MRCPDCGQKECCGASMHVELDQLRQLCREQQEGIIAGLGYAVIDNNGDMEKYFRSLIAKYEATVK